MRIGCCDYGNPRAERRRWGLAVETDKNYRGVWEIRVGPLEMSWDHFNPEYQYTRVLHVQIGRLVFSIGWTG